VRILFLSDVFLPRVNGVSTSIQTFRQALERHGHTVDLVAPGYGGEDVGEPGVHRVRGMRVPRDPEDRIVTPGSMVRRVESLGPSGFEVVHVHTPFAAHRAGVVISRRHGVALVETFHTMLDEYAEHYLPLVPRRLSRSLVRRYLVRQARRARRVIAPSRALRDRLTSYGISTPIDVIPTGLDPGAFEAGNRGAMRGRLGLADAAPIVAYVGRLAHEKNILRVLEVMLAVLDRLPRAHAVFAGLGPALETLERRVAGSAFVDRVHWLGYLDRRTELPDLYAAADVLLFASLTETQGLVPLEAMAAGLPLVAIPALGTRDLLATGKGVLLATTEPGDLEAKAFALLENEPLRRRLGHEARAVAAEWSSERSANLLLECYRRAVVSSAAASTRTAR
jgi:glycosyltransferase involved in cell wall biosynthesis